MSRTLAFHVANFEIAFDLTDDSPSTDAEGDSKLHLNMIEE